MTERKIAVVTGSNKSLGYSIVKGLCKKFDGDVYLTARNVERGEKAVQQLKKLGFNPLFHQLDITDQLSIDRFAEYLKINHGGIDILINNAAILYEHRSPESEPFKAKEQIRVNYYGTLRVSNALSPLLRQNGRIIHITSAAGHLSQIQSAAIREKLSDRNLTISGLSKLMDEYVQEATEAKEDINKTWADWAYGTSKVGVSCLVGIQQKNFDTEIPNRNIAVNSVHPGTWADPQTNEYEIPQGKPPAFVTPGQTYRIASGATVILPCRITQPGSFVLAWKRGIAVLTAGPVKVSPDPRLRVLPSPTIESPVSSIGGVPELSGGGYSLELRDVRPQDAGDYICQLGTIEPKEIVHTLEVLVPARIHFVSHSGTVEVTQGQMVKMECRASGNPVPSVSWTRKNNVMPSGERSIQGLTMVIQHADRHSAGQYQCSADNSVGEPDTKHININVLYPPEVEVERTTVHTGIGLEAQLVCIVYAEPSAQVLWFKETTQLGTTEQHTTQARGNRYTLTIRNVSQVDMGNYSCVASNVHGKSRGHIFLAGTATTAAISSPPIGSDRDKYTLSWSVNSHASIIEYRLFYRQQPRHHHQHRQEEPIDFRSAKINGTRMVGMRPEWTSLTIAGPGVVNPNYVVPPPYPGVTKQKMSHTILHLLPATTYEARVQAKNEHGWNKLSPIFHFTTRANDMENLIEPSAQPAVYGSNQGQDMSSHQMRPFASYGLYCLSVYIYFNFN